MTNTISEGDTRRVGIEQIQQRNIDVFRAVKSRKWPGTAALEVAHVWVHCGPWKGEFFLDGNAVHQISASLASGDGFQATSSRLETSKNKAFMGATVLGTGFIMSIEEAQALIEANETNKDVLFPYLNGDDVNSRPDSSPSRWIVDFFNWPLEKAEEYADCLNILRHRVKPERDKLIGKNPTSTRRGKHWWLYAQDANKMFRAIADQQRVLVKSGVSKYHAFAFLDTGFVPAHAVFVFAFQDYGSYSVLQSCFHEAWAGQHSSSLETRQRYTPTSCFETFVFPDGTETCCQAGEAHYGARSSVMHLSDEGLTKTYNRYHAADETLEDIQKLRDLHVEMDKAVAAAYGWDDVDLGHGFHETKQGIRFTISEAARREVLARLLKLNHERYAEEVAQGLHDKKGKAQKAASRKRAKKKESAAVRHTGKLIEDEPTMKDFPSDQRFGVNP